MYSIKSKLKITQLNDDTKDQIKYLFRKFILNAKQRCFSKRIQFLHRTLQSLFRNSDIKICKFDKGRGVAVLNSEDYYAKSDLIVSNTSKFVEISIKENETYPVIKKENSISNYIREYMKEYGKEVTTSLLPTGSVPGKLYGLIEGHKKDNPARPVVLMIKTPEYKLTKFLDSIIKPHVLNSYIVQSTDDFLTKLKDFDFNSNQFLVS